MKLMLETRERENIFRISFNLHVLYFHTEAGGVPKGAGRKKQQEA